MTDIMYEKKGMELLEGGGLSLVKVLERQETEGFNEIPSDNPKKLYYFIFNVLKEPMVYLILGCGIAYFFLGDHQEALMLLAFLFIIIGITAIQEAKSDKAIHALRELSSPRAEVLRNGVRSRIPGREVVRDDIIFLNEGDRIPADAILLSGSHLNIDESLLTGESLPVLKKTSAPLFASTTVVFGEGIAMVQATGSHSQVGKIGKSIINTEVISTQLEKQTRSLVTRLAWFATGLCILVVLVYSVTRHNLLEGILVGLSLGMAILPNELPAVLTIFFALGAWRLSKKKILTRKISAIENLGSITVLCTDKTGTLTLNQMAVQKLYSQNQFIDLSDSKLKILPEEFHEVLEFGILASKKNPHDPMELAFASAGIKYLSGTEHLHHDWNLEKEYPISPKLLSITHAWKSKSEEGFIVGAKGAPEAIIDLCHMNKEEEQKIKKASDEMALLGLRILGVAKSDFKRKDLPEKQHDFTFTFLGLIGIADPIRSGVYESISECHTAGIRVIMLTGDHPTTAGSIAQKIGLKNPLRILTGSEIEKLSPEDMAIACKEVNVFSRVMPAQKLLLVEALKKAGEIVAMTGDGVNDAPALKSSHIGIAMGKRGTDVARESSAIVLLDDDFSSIVLAIRSGRRIYANIKNALVYLFAIHIPIAGMSVIPVLTKLPLVLMPAHIAYLHLIIEPASSMAFEVEAEGKYLMNQGPRSPTEPLFNKAIWYSSLFRGLILLLALTSIYIIALKRKLGEEEARTLVMTTLLLANAFLIYLSRPANISFYEKMKSKPNNVVKSITVFSVALLIASLYIPSFRYILRFSYLHPNDLFMCITVAFLSTLVSELIIAKKPTQNSRQ
jgi:Ca2+-transporting ATPase